MSLVDFLVCTVWKTKWNLQLGKGLESNDTKVVLVKNPLMLKLYKWDGINVMSIG